jgi:hypothetical protein
MRRQREPKPAKPTVKPVKPSRKQQRQEAKQKKDAASAPIRTGSRGGRVVSGREARRQRAYDERVRQTMNKKRR